MYNILSKILIFQPSFFSEFYLLFFPFFSREQDATRFKQWSKQEETFHLEQARLRSKIRIKDGRATTIDLLARYLDVLEGNESAPDTELHEPYVYMNGLGKNELEDLQADIQVRKIQILGAKMDVQCSTYNSSGHDFWANFGYFQPNFGEIWLKSGQIWCNSSSQKIP